MFVANTANTGALRNTPRKLSPVNFVGGGMTEFGVRLRELRVAAGLRQADLAAALVDGVARSTIANIEAGRQRPSPRFWSLLCQHLPPWESELAAAYAQVRESEADISRSAGADPAAAPLGGPFVLERLVMIYTFRHSRAPEEIVELRRVRALANGADSYGLKLVQSESANFAVEEEALFGGHFAHVEHHRVEQRTVYLRTFRFPRPLRRGQRHEFAVRSWVSQDDNPGTSVELSFTMPVAEVRLHLNFFGPDRPAAVWRFGPLADSDLVPAEPFGPDLVDLQAGGALLHLESPQIGSVYGLSWRW